MTDHEPDYEVESALASIKSVIAIINGLALTNGPLVLLTGAHYSHITRLDKLGAEHVILTIVLMVNILRFYHGNVRVLDSTYGGRHGGDQPHRRGGLGVDFCVVFTQSILFSIASFYVTTPDEYILLFIILLGFDAIWGVPEFFSRAKRRWPRGRSVIKNLVAAVTAIRHAPAYLTRTRHGSPQGGWFVNNLVATILLAVLYLIHRTSMDTWAMDVAIVVLVLNTALDFADSWSFYFPRPTVNRAPATS
jgi:hypothetical protein